jgi:peptide/nickel transport system substrate-binding protein
MENLIIGDLSKGPRGTNECSFTDPGYIPTRFVKGNLAESWETPDPLTIVLHLRKGVMFQAKPGVMVSREMTADDVVFCINRIHDSPKITLYGNYVKPAASAKDKYTVVVKMKEFDANWVVNVGTGYYTRIYPPELVKAGINDWKNAVGTGPFILTSYVSGASLTFEKNPNYWGTTTIDGKEYKLPFVDKLEWPIIVDESTRLAALRTGKCDINESVSYKYRDSLAQTNPDLTRYKYLVVSHYPLVMRMDVKPFDDIRVRRAISMAIDREGYITSFCGGDAEMLPWPYPSSWGEDFYTPIDKLPESARELFEYNPTKAKQLLADAGYPTGFKTEMVIQSTMGDYGAFLAANLKQNLGVEVELKLYDYAVYLSIMYGRTYKAMYFMGRSNSDPLRILTTSGVPGELWNSAMMNDPYYTENIKKAATMTNEVERNKLLKELNVYLIDQVGYAIIPSGYTYSYAQPWVKNWYGDLNLSTRGAGLVHANAWLDLNLKKKKLGKM